MGRGAIRGLAEKLSAYGSGQCWVLAAFAGGSPIGAVVFDKGGMDAARAFDVLCGDDEDFAAYVMDPKRARAFIESRVPVAEWDLAGGFRESLVPDAELDVDVRA